MKYPYARRHISTIAVGGYGDQMGTSIKARVVIPYVLSLTGFGALAAERVIGTDSYAGSSAEWVIVAAILGTMSVSAFLLMRHRAANRIVSFTAAVATIGVVIAWVAAAILLSMLINPPGN
jgi:hypothetical protein